MSNRLTLKSWPIRKKLLLLLLVVFLPVAGIIVTAGLHQRQDEIEKAQDNALLLVQSLAAQQEQIAIATKQMLTTLAALPEVQRLDAVACNELFRELNDRHPFYSTIAAATPDGNMFAASTPFKPGSVDLSDRKHIKDAIRALDFSAGEYIVGRVSKTQSVNYTYPVLDANKSLIAIVIAGFKLDEYGRFLAKLNLPEGATVVVTDHAGVRLYRLPDNDAAAVGKPIPRAAFKLQSGDIDQGIFEWTSQDGIHRIYAFKQLRLREDAPRYLNMIVGIPKDIVLRKANLDMLRNLLILGATALMAMSLAWIFGNISVVKPIDRLVTATQRLGSGEMGARTNLPHTSDELGQLAKSFDHMASLLETKDLERKEAETKLSQEKLFSDSIIRSLPGVFYVFDAKGKCYRWNDNLMETTGYSAEEISQMSPLDYFEGEGCGKVAEALQEVALKGHSAIEADIKSKDGRKTPFHLTGVRLGVDNEDYLIGVGIDLSDRKQAEQALLKQYELQRVLFSAIPAYVYIKDADSVYMAGNKRFSELSRMPENEIPGKTDYDFFSEADADSFRSNDAEIIATGKARLDYEMRGTDAEGNTIWFSTSKCPFYGPSGEVAGLVGICIDITERKRAEEERLKLEQRLQQAQKAESLGRMAGAIAHHFNNLLGAVMGNLELAMIGLPQGSKPLAKIAEAMKASGRAADISRLMLAYLGQSIATTSPIDLSEVCRETLSLITPSLPKRVTLRTDLPDTELIVRADAVQIRQILTNLLVNAGEAIGDREGDVTVALHELPAADIQASRFYPAEWEPKDEGYACLSVSDTGIGMDPETLENVFDPFFSTKFTGRGLGAAVVLGVVKAHEGAVTVESSAGEGAVFRVFLPLSVEKLPLPRKAEPVDTAPFKDRGLVLLVEDEPMLRTLAGVMLEHLGYEVITAADGVEALEIFRKQQDRVQCVLLDLTMPRMDGWETLAALRALRPNLPVILASGYDEAKVMQGDHPHRPQAFLPKPYVMKGLEAVLDAVLKS